jgi:hypothetical protein
MIPSKSLRASSIPGILAVVGLLLVVGYLLYPKVSTGPYPSGRTQAKNDAVQIATALNLYFNEYGRFPSVPPGNANSAKLMNILADTLAKDPDNPRQIVFLEVPKAKSHRNGADTNGSGYTSGYKDPWGNDYEIRIDTSLAEHPEHPTVEGTDGTVAKPVIVWSRGDPAKTRDYEDKAKWIKSWE